MANPMVAEVNCTTGVHTTREMTEAEMVQRTADIAAHEVRKAAEDATALATATAKASAQAKLKALGLSDEEIAAL